MNDSNLQLALQNATSLSHVSIGTNSYAEALAFYDQVLATLNIHRIFEEPEVKAVAYGKKFPEFWVQMPLSQKPASVGNGSHFAFLALTKESVDQFYSVAMKAGATDDGAPGARPHYSDAYYGCFVRDLDGHKIEATFWDEALANSSM